QRLRANTRASYRIEEKNPCSSDSKRVVVTIVSASLHKHPASKWLGWHSGDIACSSTASFDTLVDYRNWWLARNSLYGCGVDDRMDGGDRATPCVTTAQNRPIKSGS